jgi:hypothetical protein
MSCHRFLGCRALKERKQFAAGASLAAQLRSQGQELGSRYRHVFAAQADARAALLACGAVVNGVLEVIFA